MKKYLLFDLDGTLTDPKVGICTCVQYALSSFGIEEPDLDKLEPFIGPPLKDSFMKYYDMDEARAEAAIEKYRERFRDTGIFENKLYDGIPQMLNALNSQGMFMAVASSKPTEFVRRILDHFGIGKYFKVVVGSEMDGTRVRKEEVIQEALKQLFGNWPVEKTKVYMIGDRSYDVEGARKVGVECVGVTYGYGSMEELREAKCDYIVRSVEELQKFLLRGTEKKDQLTTSQRIWQMVLPFLIFFLARNIALNVGAMILVSIGSRMSGGDFLFIRNAQGELESMTGNAAVLVSTFGYMVAGLSVWNMAKKTIARTAEDMKLLHIKAEPVKNYCILAGATAGLALGLNFLFLLTGTVEGSQAYQEVAQAQYAAWFPIGLVSFGIITPIAEELLFRGVIFGCIKRYMKLSAAMLVSSIFFALYHGNSVQALYAVVLGYLMAYAYEYFGDFRIAVAVHVLANVLSYVLSYIPAVSVLANWPVCIAALAAGAGCAWMLHKEKKIL
jgi:phosphoglycolate phosphatase-like HAD superfamily hydrolase/membrane protease YdiL (CAAX protease family)